MAVHRHAAAGQPVANYITRAAGVGTMHFAENSVPMASSNIDAWACLTKRSKALDMYTGQSVHSTRRGE